jgi:hypothetical protein
MIAVAAAGLSPWNRSNGFSEPDVWPLDNFRVARHPLTTGDRHSTNYCLVVPSKQHLYESHSRKSGYFFNSAVQLSTSVSGVTLSTSVGTASRTSLPSFVR